MTTLETEIAKCNKAIAKAEHFKTQLPVFVPVIESLETLRMCHYYPEQAMIIMGVQTREDWAKVRALHVGKWDKITSASENAGDVLRYQANINGVDFNCYVNEAPPSCKIEVTYREVPAHRMEIRKLVCNDPTKDEALAEVAQ